jgi:hypothetical protein
MIFSKSLILFGALWACLALNSKSKSAIDQPTEVCWEDLVLDTANGVYLHQGLLFSGTSFEWSFPSGRLLSSVEFIDGKKHGVSRKWYEDGTLSYEAFYLKAKLDGPSRSWWPNGKLRTESNFEEGVVHGVQKQWYQSGAIFKQRNIEYGKELGLQRAWRENGKLYCNYEAKNGRNYGLKRASMCFRVEEEQVVYSP